MTKKEIVDKISGECGLTQLQTMEVVQRTLDAIIQTLLTEGRIELRNFGVFQVEHRAARSARNPHTGEKIIAPAKNVVTFKPGREVQAQVQTKEVAPEPGRGRAAEVAAPKPKVSGKRV